jgi:hypothetical protein
MRLLPLPLAGGAPLLAVLALAVTACLRTASGPIPGATHRAHVEQDDVREQEEALADDSMQGRLTGTPGMERAARYLAGRFRHFGVQPAGEDGYFQHLPLAAAPGGGPLRLRLLDGWGDTLAVPAALRRRGINVVGVVHGSDPVLRGQTVLIDAHYDHLGVSADGVCTADAGDTVCNGADDDASGDVAVLEIARDLAHGPPPRRTVVLLLTTGEELGLLGTRWYIRHPAAPISSMVANMEIEMIGRPDSALGGPGRAWLTGYDRSTMGEMLASAGVPIVADPRPAENFFERSDNIAFARMGVPAHTLSSFGLHGDYHTARDDAAHIDYAHMTRVVAAAVQAARLLADGPAPVWKPGGRPGAP